VFAFAETVPPQQETIDQRELSVNNTEKLLRAAACRTRAKLLMCAGVAADKSREKEIILAPDGLEGRRLLDFVSTS
jgi:hypothetical protein